MLSLNQITDKIDGYFADHALIRTTLYLDDADFKSLETEDISYPVANYNFMNATVSGKMLNYNFKIIVADLVQADNTDHEKNVISDAILIAEDFCSFLQYEEGWNFNKSSSIQPFTEKGVNRTSGVVFTFQISVVRAQNTCNKPTH